MTTRLVDDRVDELFDTSLPQPFRIEERILTSFPRDAEKAAHDLLSHFRPSRRREFFVTDVQTAVNAVRDAVLIASGVGAWSATGVHPIPVTTSDRLCLALLRGQVFVVMEQDHESGGLRVVDIWECHQEGDSLQVMGAQSAGHVAGVGPLDPGGTEDPVPWLDRKGKTGNCPIVRRERMTPGTRLVWVDDLSKPPKVIHAVFDLLSYGQIVYRTDAPQVDAHGRPLLLNNLMREPSTMTRVASLARHVLDVPFAGAFSAGPDAGGEIPPWGSDTPSAEYWMPQLRPRG
jgi:hypothetical protein